MIPMEYRKKHPRCRYCKYLEVHKRGWYPIFIYNCKVKDKIKAVNNLFIGKGMFCKVFEPQVM